MYTAGSNTGKGVVAMKKAALGAAIAVGAGTAGFVMLHEDPLPAVDFGGFETPQVQMETKKSGRDQDSPKAQTEA